MQQPPICLSRHGLEALLKGPYYIVVIAERKGHFGPVEVPLSSRPEKVTGYGYRLQNEFGQTNAF